MRSQPLLYSYSSLCDEFLLSLLLLRFSPVFGFRPFDYDVARCGFLCFYLGFVELLVSVA